MFFCRIRAEITVAADRQPGRRTGRRPAVSIPLPSPGYQASGLPRLEITPGFVAGRAGEHKRPASRPRLPALPAPMNEKTSTRLPWRRWPRPASRSPHLRGACGSRGATLPALVGRRWPGRRHRRSLHPAQPRQVIPGLPSPGHNPSSPGRPARLRAGTTHWSLVLPWTQRSRRGCSPGPKPCGQRQRAGPPLGRRSSRPLWAVLRRAWTEPTLARQGTVLLLNRRRQQHADADLGAQSASLSANRTRTQNRPIGAPTTAMRPPAARAP